MVSFQLPWLANLLGLSFVGLIGCVVACATAPPTAGRDGAGIGGRLRRDLPAGGGRSPVLELLGAAAHRRRLGLRCSRAVVREVAQGPTGRVGPRRSIGVVVAIVVFVGAFGRAPARPGAAATSSTATGPPSSSTTRRSPPVRRSWPRRPAVPSRRVDHLQHRPAAGHPIASADQLAGAGGRPARRPGADPRRLRRGRPRATSCCTDVTRAAAAETGAAT